VIPRHRKRWRRAKVEESCTKKVLASSASKGRKKAHKGIDLFLRLQAILVLEMVLEHGEDERVNVFEDEADDGLTPRHDEGKGAVEVRNVATLNGSKGFVAAEKKMSLTERGRKESICTLLALRGPPLRQVATSRRPDRPERVSRRVT
jgi:hypothetical protein